MQVLAMYSFLLLLVSVQQSSGYLTFHKDYNLTEAQLSEMLLKETHKLKEFNDDMPEQCRTDICKGHITVNDRKGNIIWPDIIVGTEIKMRCPFSFDTPIYVTRECVVNGSSVVWDNPNPEGPCPDPPLATLIMQLDEEEKTFTNFSSYNYQLGVLQRFKDCFLQYRNTPINTNDIVNELDHLFKMSDIVVGQADSVPIEVAEDIVYLFNILLDDDLRWKLRIVFKMTKLKFSSRFKSLLTALPLKIDRTSDIVNLRYSHISLIGIQVTNVTMTTINITDAYTQRPCEPNVLLHIKNIFSGKPVKISIMMIKEGHIFQRSYRYTSDKLVRGNLKSFSNKNNKIKNRKPLDAGSKYNTISQPLEIDYSNNTRYSNGNTESSALGYTDVTHALTLASSNISPSSVGYTDVMHSLPPTPSNIDSGTSIIVIGKLLILSTSREHQKIVGKNIEVPYHYGVCAELRADTGCETIKPPECVRAAMNLAHYTKWSSTGCTQLNSTSDQCGTCHCTGLGAFGVFSSVVKTKTTGNSLATTTNTLNTNLAVFLGFPYNRELEIVGMCLSVVSLVCLAITIASYALFRHTRRGTPTTILMNLCVAMIVMYVMFLTVQITGTLTIVGCTVTNVLRYYLVFVTLLWNGVEAVNMYLMLVKVFNSNISKFALKAGVVAWGLPVLMIGVAFAIKDRAFKGQYAKVTNSIRDKCVFKCQLRDNTLYYGYLIPMGVIIAHNMIVFGLVLRILIKHSKTMGRCQKRSKMIQLVGAFATLVLLGVPWIFSSFGAIDATKSDQLAMMEGTFQVIFVVFVNLQGLFIFIFHCMRNDEVRIGWRSVVSMARNSILSLSTKNRFYQESPKTSSKEDSHRSGTICKEPYKDGEEEITCTNQDFVDLRALVISNDTNWHCSNRDAFAVKRNSFNYFVKSTE